MAGESFLLRLQLAAYLRLGAPERDLQQAMCYIACEAPESFPE